ncbi:hypothetical protein MMC06_000378 [Schaereria dolodes]|nr:hypothetical protein [Schaereria dolodes]
MSFNARNLTYESNEPSFLRKLKSEYGSNSSGRHERPIARPRKAQDDGDDNEPTYVDEGSHDTISKAEYDAMLNSSEYSVDGKDMEQSPSVADTEAAQPETASEKINSGQMKEQKLAAIGSLGKRKIARVIGGDERRTELKTDGRAAMKGKKLSKPKRKIKLSFDEVATDT